MCRDRQADKHKERNRLIKVNNKDKFQQDVYCRSLLYGVSLFREVSVQKGARLGVPVQKGSLSRVSLSRGSLCAEGVSVQGVSVQGVSVQRRLCQGVPVQGVFVQGSLSRRVLCPGCLCPERVSVQRMSLSRRSLSRGSLSRVLCPEEVSVQGVVSLTETPPLDRDPLPPVDRMTDTLP